MTVFNHSIVDYHIFATVGKVDARARYVDVSALTRLIRGGSTVEVRGVDRAGIESTHCLRFIR
jgi:hypothetical protein